MDQNKNLNFFLNAFSLYFPCNILFIESSRLLLKNRLSILYHNIFKNHFSKFYFVIDDAFRFYFIKLTNRRIVQFK